MAVVLNIEWVSRLPQRDIDGIKPATSAISGRQIGRRSRVILRLLAIEAGFG